jgi:hypothetical protein
VLAQPDPSKVREFPDNVRDGKIVLSIGRRMPLHDAAEAHVLGEKAVLGRFSCWCRIHKIDFFNDELSETEIGARCRAPSFDFEARLHSLRSERVKRLSMSCARWLGPKCRAPTTHRLRVGVERIMATRPT